MNKQNKTFLDTSTSKVKIVRKNSRKNAILKCKFCKELIPIEFHNKHACYIKMTSKISASNQKKRKKVESIDLEKQCGVPIVSISKSTGENLKEKQTEVTKLCKNGFTCKLHTLEDKRKVKGRLYCVDILIKMANEERKRKRHETKIKEKNEEINDKGAEKSASTGVKNYVELDNEIKQIVNNIRPVVNKIWFCPRLKNENNYIRNIFLKNPFDDTKRERK